MGQSTDAILFYGYCWQEEIDFGWGDNPDWVDVVFKKRGHVDPWATYPNYGDKRSPDYIADYDKRMDAYQPWHDANDAAIEADRLIKKDIEIEFWVDLRYRQKGNSKIPYLCVPNMRIVASCESPEEIDLHVFSNVGMPNRHDLGYLDRWFAEMGIAKPHPEPQWWLVSYRG